MKKILIVLSVFITITGSAQLTKGVFFDFHSGVRIGGETSDQATLRAGFNTNGGVGYMFNDYVGIRGDLGIKSFKALDVNTEGFEDKSLMISSSLEGILSISEVAGFLTRRFDFKLHSGVGITTISNPGYKEEYTKTREFEDNLFKGNDDVFHFVFGVSPQVKLNRFVSVSADLSHTLLYKQGHSLDRQIGNVKLEEGFVSNITTVSLGLYYRL